MTTSMKCMFRIHQRDQDIDIEQSAHELHAFLVHYLADMLKGYYFSARGK